MHCTAGLPPRTCVLYSRFCVSCVVFVCPTTPSAVQVTFHDPVRYGLQKELFIAAEGMYSGQVRQQRAHRATAHVFLELSCTFASRGPA